jgi:hypothetical protein
MKKLAMALATLGLSCGAFAAFPGATDPTLINIPDLSGGFVFGIMMDYLQPSPSNGDLDYASLNTLSPLLKSSLADVVPGYQWGFGFNLGYVFPDTGNDLNISYSHLETTDTQNVFSNNIHTISAINPTFLFFGGVPLMSNLTIAMDRAEYNINQVDLTLGQMINVGCRVRLHPNVGFRIAQIERRQFITYSGSDPITTTQPLILTSSEDSDFTGIGPLAGLDASYYLGMGFGAVAHLDAAALIGSIDETQQPLYTGPGIVTSLLPSPQFYTISGDSKRVVPETEAKLGLDYTYLFNNANNSNMTLEIGYQASEYYDAVDRLNSNVIPTFTAIGAPEVRASFINSQVTKHSTSNIGLNGAYATLIFHI